ncbi:MAG TPA: RNA methyltransferase [Bacteroidales bacterium]|nr:RNA methyltransferase [Bacteroidales bacterium]
MTEKFQMVAKTLQGLEEVLAEELKEISAENIEVGCRSVSYIGTKETLYKSNFWLRTALRVLKPIYVFNARTIDELYGNARKFDWTSVMELSHKFAVESVVNSELFPHSRYIALKLKDAIADQFRDRFGKRPFVDPKKPHITFHIHVNNDVCTVSLDSSGESLHRRGYRVAQDVAPINEVLAAGLIKLSGWNGDSVFIDPMCGSGTILIEAALIAYGIAPGIFRQHFGFENWLDFDEQLLQSIYNDDSRERDFEYLILGRDISKQAIASAMENIKESGLHKKIDLGAASIFDYNPPKVEKGIVITNPPYGERLKKEQIENFYKQLSDVFKNKYAGYDVWIISSNQEALKSFGLRPSKKINLLNGALECKYQRFSMYKGSLKSKQS